MSITLENKDGLVDEEENRSGGELCDAARVMVDYNGPGLSDQQLRVIFYAIGRKRRSENIGYINMAFGRSVIIERSPL